MEGTKHEFVLKKTVAMFNKLTGKKMTTKEGGAFLDLYDFVADHAGPDTPAEPTPWDKATSETAAEAQPQTIERAPGPVDLEIPAFIGREVEKAVAPEPEQPQSAAAVLEEAMSRGNGLVVVTDSPDTKVKPARREFTFAPAPAEPAPARPAKYAPPPIRTSDREHIPGYDWQIVVLDRQKREENSYIVHFANAPTQDEFDEHFALFASQSHYVHLNEWIRGDWQGITDSYRKGYSRPAKPAEQPAPLPASTVVHQAKAPEPELVGRDVSQPAISAPWEQADKAFRIRYHSDALGGINFHYVDKKPSRAEMAHFHHTKCLAAVQSRPTEGAA
ncbi:hypothetical protein PEp14_00047 [Erwinia phage PEp14]|uniref:Uncharacterized protein n=1 Tax=Erwinia phage PEp14 TaxID=1131315 RepID=H2DE77_9CAUD|nr:hypothetical protein PEp14_00047 [Erwinia phage PEp14]AEY69636.1 hypothetical protein PEp14_00047 [Erwinia phage PEp14]